MKNYQKTQKTYKVISSIIAMVIIPLYSIWFAFRQPVLSNNLSGLGGMLGYMKELVLWGVITGSFFFVFIRFLFRLVGIRDLRMTARVGAGAIFLIATVLVPWNEQLPLQSELHNLFACGAVICFGFSMYQLIFSIKELDPVIFRKSFRFLNIVVIISGILLFNTGVSSLTEITAAIGIGFVLIFTYLQLCESTEIDTIKALELIDVQKAEYKQERVKQRQKQLAQQKRVRKNIQIKKTAVDKSVASEEAFPKQTAKTFSDEPKDVAEGSLMPSQDKVKGVAKKTEATNKQTSKTDEKSTKGTAKSNDKKLNSNQSASKSTAVKPNEVQSKPVASKSTAVKHDDVQSSKEVATKAKAKKTQIEKQSVVVEEASKEEFKT